MSQSSKDENSDIMNNFKCLQNQKNSGKSKNLSVDYGQIFKKFNENLKKHEKNFDFGNYEKKIFDIDSDFLLFEEILLEKYREVSSEIMKKKNILLKLRESTALSLGTIRRLQAEV